jgi:methylated-DNA-[protein]-cysteine S-methyltransferase
MPDAPDRYCLFDTAVGPCGIAWSGEGITRLQLPETDRAATERRIARAAVPAPENPPPDVARAIADIQRYLAGEHVDFTAVMVDLKTASAFQLAVYAAARAVPFGCTATYGELARRAGFPGEARAVGRAMAQNPVPVVIPCHRIVPADDRVGGFSAPGGTFTKERLLVLEGVRLDLLSP